LVPEFGFLVGESPSKSIKAMSIGKGILIDRMVQDSFLRLPASISIFTKLEEVYFLLLTNIRFPVFNDSGKNAHPGVEKDLHPIKSEAIPRLFNRLINFINITARLPWWSIARKGQQTREGMSKFIDNLLKKGQKRQSEKGSDENHQAIIISILKGSPYLPLSDT
jgi:hypothetical protein